MNKRQIEDLKVFMSVEMVKYCRKLTRSVILERQTVLDVLLNTKVRLEEELKNINATLIAMNREAVLSDPVPCIKCKECGGGGTILSWRNPDKGEKVLRVRIKLTCTRCDGYGEVPDSQRL